MPLSERLSLLAKSIDASGYDVALMRDAIQQAIPDITLKVMGIPLPLKAVAPTVLDKIITDKALQTYSMFLVAFTQSLTDEQNMMLDRLE